MTAFAVFEDEEEHMLAGDIWDGPAIPKPFTGFFALADNGAKLAVVFDAANLDARACQLARAGCVEVGLAPDGSGYLLVVTRIGADAAIVYMQRPSAELAQQLLRLELSDFRIVTVLVADGIIASVHDVPSTARFWEIGMDLMLGYNTGDSSAGGKAWKFRPGQACMSSGLIRTV